MNRVKKPPHERQVKNIHLTTIEKPNKAKQQTKK